MSQGVNFYKWTTFGDTNLAICIPGFWFIGGWLEILGLSEILHGRVNTSSIVDLKFTEIDLVNNIILAPLLKLTKAKLPPVSLIAILVGKLLTFPKEFLPPEKSRKTFSVSYIEAVSYWLIDLS